MTFATHVSQGTLRWLWFWHANRCLAFGAETYVGCCWILHQVLAPEHIFFPFWMFCYQQLIPVWPFTFFHERHSVFVKKRSFWDQDQWELAAAVTLAPENVACVAQSIQIMSWFVVFYFQPIWKEACSQLKKIIAQKSWINQPSSTWKWLQLYWHHLVGYWRSHLVLVWSTPWHYSDIPRTNKRIVCWPLPILWTFWFLMDTAICSWRHVLSWSSWPPPTWIQSVQLVVGRAAVWFGSWHETIHIPLVSRPECRKRNHNICQTGFLESSNGSPCYNFPFQVNDKPMVTMIATERASKEILKRDII